MAKRAKELEITKRYNYKPDNERCSECDEPLKLQKYYQWRKTVQQMTGTVHVASRGGECVNPICSRKDHLVKSTVAELVSLPECTYGLDVIAQIGWWRDREHQDRKEIHSRLVGRGVQLSERQVDYLYNRYQILLACVGNQDRSSLEAVVEEHGGLKLCLDGLSPEGASEQLWVVREVESQITLVVAWLDKVNHETLQTLLGPVVALEMPILATVSDKQPCLKKALEQLWPEMPHQWCQPHFLGNIAGPIYERDRMLKTEMCQEIRAEIRESLAEVLDDENESAVHFVAGAALNATPATHLNTSRTDEPMDDELPDDEPPDDEPPSLGLETLDSIIAELTPEERQEPSHTQLESTVASPEQTKSSQQIVRDFALDLKICLSRQGRAPFIFSGLPMLDDLTALRDTILACLKINEDPYLRHWADVLTRILPDYTDDFAEVAQAQKWVKEISTILKGPPNLLMLASHSIPHPSITTGQCVKHQFKAFLKRLFLMTDLSPFLNQFRTKLFGITNRYWAGLFHCYDISGLPRSNNALESLFGQAKRQIRRRLGIHSLRDALRRQAPWALLETTATSVDELLVLFQHVSLDDYHAQRALFDARLQQLLHRFRFRHRRDALLQQRLSDWADAAPAT